MQQSTPAPTLQVNASELADAAASITELAWRLVRTSIDLESLAAPVLDLGHSFSAEASHAALSAWSAVCAAEAEVCGSLALELSRAAESYVSTDQNVARLVPRPSAP